jgi:MFS family permease
MDDKPKPPAYEEPEFERVASAAPTEGELEQEVPGAIQAKHDPYAALRHRDYRLYAIGGLFGTISGQMQFLAVEWELYERMRQVVGVKESALYLGLVGLVQAIPVILLALFAGQIADRIPRKRIILCTNSVLCAVALGLAFVSYSHAAVGWYYVLLFLAGMARAFEGPARSAYLTQLVDEKDFANATTWNSSRWQFAAMAGPALGGGAIVYFNRAAPIYVIDAICLAINFSFIAMTRGRPQNIVKESVTIKTLLAGWEFVRSTPLVIATITLDMFAVFFGGAIALLPVYARDILHVGPTGLGWLRAAPAVGALMMAMALTHLPPMRRAGTKLTWAVIGFGLATVVFGFSQNFWLSLFALALTGALDNISVVIRHTLVQVLTPDSMRGRVSAVNNVFIGTSNELGHFESGVATRFLGPVGAVVGGGIATVLVVLGVVKKWPSVRELDTLEGAAAAHK